MNRPDSDSALTEPLLDTPRIASIHSLYHHHHLIFPQASRDRETACALLAFTGVKSMKRLPKIVSRISSQTQKAVQDTAAGCREQAAADLLRASLMETANGRRRLESSASSWMSRAQMLQDLDDSAAVRQAACRAEWEDGEPVSKARRDPDVSAAS